MSKKNVVYLSGTIHWAKIFGKPHPNYGGDAMEWTFEFEPDADGVKVLKANKVADRLKTKEGRKPFLTLKRKELRNDGDKNEHIRVYDNDSIQWPEETLIGNGSSVDVKLDIRDYGVGKFMGIYPQAIRVTKLVPYASSEFGAMDGKSAEPSGKPKKEPQFDIGLDDDVPF